MKTTKHTTHIYCLNHDTKEAFIVDTFTATTKAKSYDKASNLCDRYNNEWSYLSQIKYCVSDLDELEYEQAIKLTKKRSRRA